MTDPQTILKQTFGFDHFRGVQEQVIGRVLAAAHTLAVMPTGALRAGKIERRWTNKAGALWGEDARCGRLRLLSAVQPSAIGAD